MIMEPSYVAEFKEISSQYIVANKEDSEEISSNGEFEQADAMQVYNNEPRDARDFTYKVAFLLPFPTCANLEFIPDIEEHVDACKEGLKWLGFVDEEINDCKNSWEIPKLEKVLTDLQGRA